MSIEKIFIPAYTDGKKKKKKKSEWLVWLVLTVHSNNN